MLLDLLFSDAYLVFHIKINDDFCDLLFDTLFISLDPKHDSMYKLEQRLVTMSVSLYTQTGLHCLIIQVLNIRVYFNRFTI